MCSTFAGSTEWKGLTVATVARWKVLVSLEKYSSISPQTPRRWSLDVSIRTQLLITVSERIQVTLGQKKKQGPPRQSVQLTKCRSKKSGDHFTDLNNALSIVLFLKKKLTNSSARNLRPL
jgi:hypothetical protein